MSSRPAMPAKPANLASPATSFRPERSITPAIPAKIVSSFEMFRGPALALAAMLVIVATTMVLARRGPSAPDLAASDSQMHDSVAIARVLPLAHAEEAPASTRPVGAPAPGKPHAVSTIASTRQPEAITITGCLERDGDRFRLKDTEGDNAPKSRSWTTGFLARRNRTVDVNDERDRFNLSNRVGLRVSATGTVTDGELELRSLRRVARSCEQEG